MWTVGKRLLQHERSGMESLLAGSTGSRGLSGLSSIAKEYIGESDGKIADPSMRGPTRKDDWGQSRMALT